MGKLQQRSSLPICGGFTQSCFDLQNRVENRSTDDRTAMGYVVDKHLDSFPMATRSGWGASYLFILTFLLIRRPRTSDKKTMLFAHGRLETQHQTSTVGLARTFQPWTRDPLVSETDGLNDKDFLL